VHGIAVAQLRLAFVNTIDLIGRMRPSGQFILGVTWLHPKPGTALRVLWSRISGIGDYTLVVLPRRLKTAIDIDQVSQIIHNRMIPDYGSPGQALFDHPTKDGCQTVLTRLHQDWMRQVIRWCLMGLAMSRLHTTAHHLCPARSST